MTGYPTQEAQKNLKIVLRRRLPVRLFAENEGSLSPNDVGLICVFVRNLQVAFHFGDDIWNTCLNANCGLDGPDRSKSSGSIGTTLCPATTGLAVQERPHAKAKQLLPWRCAVTTRAEENEPL